MDYSKLNAITEPYSREFNALGVLYDNDAISKAFLKDARKLYNSAYIKEVKAFLRVAWLEEKQKLWVERYRVRTSSEEKRKELKREYDEKRAAYKRQKTSIKVEKPKNKLALWFACLFRKHLKREENDDVPEEQSQKPCENLFAGASIAPDPKDTAHENSVSAAPDKDAEDCPPPQAHS